LQQSALDIETARSVKGETGYLTMDWLVLTEGCELLTIARGRQCSVFSQRQASSSLHHFNTEWFESATNSIPLPFPVQRSVWVLNGSLLVATNNHLHVFSKWIHSSRTNTTHPTLFLEASSQQRPLPFYHPRVLVELVEGGQFDKLGFILRHLYLELFHFQQQLETERRKKDKEQREKEKTKGKEKEKAKAKKKK